MIREYDALFGSCHNFVFVGGTGSGKSEIALNFARILAQKGDKKVHFFDLDMTKPLFRSRDALEPLRKLGVEVHFQEQFEDAPTQVGGVDACLKNEDCYTILDVGGDYVGARSIGGYAGWLNRESTGVYYILNAFRPWSDSIDHIDHTLSQILGVSRIKLEQLRMVNNPHLSLETDAETVLEGCRRMDEILAPYSSTSFACAREELIPALREKTDIPLLPLHLYLTYEWNE